MEGKELCMATVSLLIRLDHFFEDSTRVWLPFDSIRVRGEGLHEAVVQLLCSCFALRVFDVAAILTHRSIAYSGVPRPGMPAAGGVYLSTEVGAVKMS